MVTIYSTGCPRCNVLKTKLTQANIEFVVSEDIDYLIEKGYQTVPVLEVDDNFMDFGAAIEWIRNNENYTGQSVDTCDACTIK